MGNDDHIDTKETPEVTMGNDDHINSHEGPEITMNSGDHIDTKETPEVTMGNEDHINSHEGPEITMKIGDHIDTKEIPDVTMGNDDHINSHEGPGITMKNGDHIDTTEIPDVTMGIDDHINSHEGPEITIDNADQVDTDDEPGVRIVRIDQVDAKEVSASTPKIRRRWVQEAPVVNPNQIESGSASPVPVRSPLPTKILITLTLLGIFHDMDTTQVFSFTPKLIRSFGTPEVKVGNYAGLLGSSMYIGTLFGSLGWSHLGDKKGKKLSIMISSSCLCASIIAFGFTRSFNWAMVTRFLQGCSFGMISVGKSLLNEYLDNTNTALAMAIFSSCGTAGFILGPGIAGNLVFPAELYPSVFSKSAFFHRFPILLPNILISFGIAVGIVIAIFFLPKARVESVTPTADEGVTEQPAPSSSRQDVAEPEDLSKPVENSNNETNNLWYRFRNTRIARVFLVRDCILTCFLYAGFCFSAVAFNELYPLLAATSHKFYGMEMSSSEIGTILMAVTGGLLFVQIPVLTKMTVLLGARRTFYISILLQAILIPFLPAMAMIHNRHILWPVLGVHIFVFRLLTQASYLSATVLINNTIPAKLNAAANGLAFMMSAMMRLTSPLVFGPVYAWSLSKVKGGPMSNFPFNQYFAFLVWAVASFILAALATLVSKCADWKLGTKEYEDHIRR